MSSFRGAVQFPNPFDEHSCIREGWNAPGPFGTPAGPWVVGGGAIVATGGIACLAGGCEAIAAAVGGAGAAAASKASDVVDKVAPAVENTVAAAANFSRALTPEDLGISECDTDILKGTYTVADSRLTVYINMIEGSVGAQPMDVIRNLMASAQSEGASVLRVGGVLGYGRLQNAMPFVARIFGGKMVTEGVTEYIEIPIK